MAIVQFICIHFAKHIVVTLRGVDHPQLGCSPAIVARAPLFDFLHLGDVILVGLDTTHLSEVVGNISKHLLSLDEILTHEVLLSVLLIDLPLIETIAVCIIQCHILLSVLKPTGGRQLATSTNVVELSIHICSLRLLPM